MNSAMRLSVFPDKRPVDDRPLGNLYAPQIPFPMVL